MGMSETLKAIADPARREILEMLKEGKKTAGEIASRFDLPGSAVASMFRLQSSYTNFVVILSAFSINLHCFLPVQELLELPPV